MIQTKLKFDRGILVSVRGKQLKITVSKYWWVFTGKFYLEFLLQESGMFLCHKGMDDSAAHLLPLLLIQHEHGIQTQKLLSLCTGSACHHQYLVVAFSWPVYLFQSEKPTVNGIKLWSMSSSKLLYSNSLNYLFQYMLTSNFSIVQYYYFFFNKYIFYIIMQITT